MDILEVNQFSCSCPEGTEGELCETLSPCSFEPCASGSTCTNLAEGFVCECPPGFTGELCDIEIDECAENPCLNGGSCTDMINGFECDCLPEFSGSECEVQVIFCELDSCSNGGTCLEEEGGFSCMCTPGYTGEFCDADFDECSVGICQNNATCVNTNGSFVCICQSGFTGELCDIEIDFCADGPCGSNGNCSSSRTGFECACLPGFSGVRCENDINECESNPCQNAGTCINLINEFMCICQTGFTGSECQNDIDECSSAPCQNGGLCNNTFGGFTCDCPIGFTGSACEEQIDFCAAEPCFNGGECTNIAGGFNCNCTTGWSGDRCQYGTVEAKLRSCGLTAPINIFSELSISTSSEGHVVFTDDTTPVEGNFSDFSTGLYFSAWVWQEDDTTAAIFTYESSNGFASLVSNLNSREVVFYFETSTGSMSVSFSNVPTEGSKWHHIAFAVTIIDIQLAIDETYHDSVNVLDFPFPEGITLQLGQAHPSQPDISHFRGLMSGAALSPVTFDSVASDLATLEDCTVDCIGGEGYCTNNGECLDLFGAQRRCLCPTAYTGPFCQYPQSTLSFEGNGFALLPEAGQTIYTFALHFKTDSLMGELATITGDQLQVTIQFNGEGLAVQLESCNSTIDSYSTDTTTSLDDLHLHQIMLSSNHDQSEISVSLDGEEVNVFNLSVPLCNNPMDHPLYLGTNFSGCIQNVEINTEAINVAALELAGDTELGCSRDTAQFQGAGSYVELPEFVSRENQTISFEFNTLDTNGIIYFSERRPTEATGPSPNDFIAIYIDAGEVVFTFNLGEEGQETTIQSLGTVNDGHWHYLTAVQNGTIASLTVDGNRMDTMATGQLEKLDTTGSVFLGSVPMGTRFEDFTGCVRDLEQNGQAVDLQTYIAIQNVHFGTCN